MPRMTTVPWRGVVRSGGAATATGAAAASARASARTAPSTSSLLAAPGPACSVLVAAALVLGVSVPALAGTTPPVRHQARTGAGGTGGVGVGRARGQDASAALPFEVTVTDRTARSTEGEPVSYHVTIRNLTDRDYPGALVSQTFAGGSRYVAAEPEGRVTGGGVSWQLDLPGGVTRAIDLTALPGTLAEAAGRRLGADGRDGSGAGNDAARGSGAPLLSTTVCVQARSGGARLACGNDTDTLAGALAAAGGGVGQLVTALSTLAVGVLLVVGTILYRRRGDRN